MEYYSDLGIYLYMIPIVCSFSFALALLINKNATVPQKYLGVTFVVFGLGMLLISLYDRYSAYENNEILRSINFVMKVLDAIFAFFYMTSLMQPWRLTKKFVSSILIWYSIFAVGFLVSDAIFLTQNPVSGWQDITENYNSAFVYVKLLAILTIIGFEIYGLSRVIKMYITHKKFIQEQYSYNERINLRWVIVVIIFFAIVGTIDLIFDFSPSVTIITLFNIVALVFVVTVFVLGSRQVAIPAYKSRKDKAEACAPEPQEEPSTTMLPTRQDEIKVALLNYFEEKKPYLDPELSLSELSSILCTNNTYLSNLINREFGINFYTFVNNYRIDYALELIETSGNKITVEAICYNSGFGSRSVFYKYFSAKVGVTPSEYIKMRTAKKIK